MSGKCFRTKSQKKAENIEEKGQAHAGRENRREGKSGLMEGIQVESGSSPLTYSGSKIGKFKG